MAAGEQVASAPSPPEGSGRLQQIDVLKGVAALSVVATHSLSAQALTDTWAVLHIWQAVPLFIVILAANAAMSFERRAASGRARVFSGQYLLTRSVRILAPFAFVWALAWIIGHDRGALQFGVESWFLQLPYPGRGNYYVPLVVALLLLAPLVFALYKRWPWLTLVGLFALDIAFELAAARIPAFTSHPFLYSVAFPRYLAAFGLGFFLVDSRLSWRVRGTALGVGAVGSLAYLYAGNTGAWAPPFLPTWRTQNVLAAFYPASLAALGLRYLPRDSDTAPLVALSWVGRASYHVFLIQILYFMLAPRPHTVLMIAVNVIMCAFAGLGFYFAELWIRGRWRGRSSIPPVRDPHEGGQAESTDSDPVPATGTEPLGR